jgi:hypothetical protein
MRKLECKIDTNQKIIMDKLSATELSLNNSGKAVANEVAKVNDIVLASEKKITEAVKVANENESWSEVVNNKKKKQAKSQANKPVVIVRPKNDGERKALICTLKTIDATKFDVEGFNNISKNGIAIKCNDADTQNTLIDELNNKFSDELTAKKPEKYVPRLKILKVYDPEASDEEFTNKLMNQNNFNHENADIKIVKKESCYIKKKKIDNCYNFIIETDSQTYDALIASRKIKHQWSIYRIVDNIHILRCYKCLQFGHLSQNCTNDLCCAKCSRNHEMKNCDSNEFCCINCLQTNNKLNLNLDIKHNTWDTSCPVYKRKVEISRKALKFVK